MKRIAILLLVVVLFSLLVATTVMAQVAPPNETNGHGEVVGGEAYPVNKFSLLAPWLALAVVIAAGGVYLVRRRVYS
jgi:hypothetical protein